MVTGLWRDFLDSEWEQEYFCRLRSFVEQEIEQEEIPVYPPSSQIFQAFVLTPLEQTRVVILGQDPYHGPGQAHGLAFSVPRTVSPPPSLRNIFAEVARAPDSQVPSSGDLTPWAQQGVLLLNTALTVRQGAAHSHRNQGWEVLISRVLAHISQVSQGVVFLLWGGKAQMYEKFIDSSSHHILTSSHPSPLSAHRGFCGCNHFAIVNDLLAEQGSLPINWSC
ncbi:uracil-DNA glycosylase [Desulfurispira natronophila]